MTRNSIQIRLAKQTDAVQIAKLCQQFGYEIDAQLVRETLERIINDPRQTVLIAAEGEKVIGWIHVFITDRLESKPFAEIGGLIIDKNYRQQGLGSKLFAQAADWVKKQGNMKLRVRCSDQRIQAHEFYLAQGMNRTKIQYIFDKTLRYF